MRRSAGLAASLFLTVLSLAGCGHGTVIGSGPVPTPTPIAPHVTNEYAVPTAGSLPGSITLANTGFLYFTEQGAGKIGQVTTGGVFKEFVIASSGGTAGNKPIDITSGPDGNVWFTEQGPAPGLASITTTNNAVKEHHITGSAPEFIAVGPSLNSLVFSDPGNNAVGQINTTALVPSETTLPTANADPLGIATNSGDTTHVYFTEYNASKIGIWDLTTNTIQEIPTLTPDAGPMEIVQGPDGAMWFTESKVAKMGRLSLSGQMTEYSLAPARSATALMTGPDNNLYFLDPAQNKIGRISGINASTVTEYGIKTPNALAVPPAFPGKFTIGPDGLIYFTEGPANKIGQFLY